MIQKKICMLGSFSVGKTSLVARFVSSVFSDKYLTTVGVNADMGQLLADLVRHEQDFDSETRAMASATRQRAAEVGALVALRNQLTVRAGQSGPASGSPFSDQLLDRSPVLDQRGGDALGVVPFRRAALAEIGADLDARRIALNAEISQVKLLGAAT